MRAHIGTTAGFLTLALIAASCASGSGDAPSGSSAPATDPTVTEPAAPDTTTPETTTTLEPEFRYQSGDSDYLFDQEQLHTFEINLPEESLAELDADPTAEEYVEGTLTFEGEEIGPIGVRYKGSVGAFLFCTDGPSPFMPSGKKTCTKLSLKLKFNWDGSDAEFYGVKKV